MLRIRWRHGEGERKDYTYAAEQQLTDRLGLKVNVANGNLLVSQLETRIAGVAGLDLAVERTYNSLDGGVDQDTTGGSNAGERPYGPGWSSTARPENLHFYNNHRRASWRDPSGSTFAVYRNQPESSDYVINDPVNASFKQVTGDAGSDLPDRYELTFERADRVWWFDNAGVPRRYRDRYGNEIRYNVVQDGTVSHIYDTRPAARGGGGSAPAVTFTHTGDGLVDAMTDAIGRMHDHAYTGGQLTGYTDPEGDTTTYAYNADGKLSEIIVTDGTDGSVDARVTISYYGAGAGVYEGRVHKIIRHDNGPGDSGGAYASPPEWEFVYSLNNSAPGGDHRTQLYDPDDKPTAWTVDGAGRVTATIDGNGHTSEQAHNGRGDIASYTTADGVNSTYTYTGNQVNEATLAVGGGDTVTTQFAYGESEHGGYASGYDGERLKPTLMTSPQGSRYGYRYDAGGQLTEVRNPDDGPAVYRIERRDDGRIDFLEGRNNSPGNEEYRRSLRTVYAYDEHRRELTGIDYPAGMGDVSVTYDALSRLASVTDGKGQLRSYVYDGVDRLERVEYRGDPSQATADVVVIYGWDAAGRQVSVSGPTGVKTTVYDDVGRVRSEDPPAGESTVYDYYPNGALRTVTPSGGATITYLYDLANQVTVIREPGEGGGTVDTTFAYRDDGLPRRITFPNGTAQVVGYDGGGRVVRVRAGAWDGSSLTGTDVELAYDYVPSSAGGESLQIAELEVGHRDGTYDYDYDGLDRLRSAVRYGPAGGRQARWEYRYDARSNRTAWIRYGSSDSVVVDERSYGYSRSDVLASIDGDAAAVAADGNGNLTTVAGDTFAYNVADQTSSVNGVAAAYLADGQDERLTAGGHTFTGTVLGVGVDDDGSTRD